MEQLTPAEQAKREALRRKKPLVYEKIIKLAERHKQDIPTPIIDIAYNYACDLKCSHCMTTRITPKKNKLNVDKLRVLTDEADKLGICQLVLSGGEPLIFKDLDLVVDALQPDKFHLKLSTHGRHLTPEMGKRLSRIGIDKVCISLDQFHGDNPLSNNSEDYSQSVQALFTVKENGMDAVMTTVVTRQNCRDEHLIRLAEFATEHDFKFDVYLAKPIGEWHANFDIMITQDDYEYLESLHKIYPTLFIDTFPSYGISRGCNAIRSIIHLTPYGDILPCGFTHVSIGNIFEESLADVINRGMRLKHYNKAPSICLSGRSTSFMKKIFEHDSGASFPPSWRDVFPDDFV